MKGVGFPFSSLRGGSCSLWYSGLGGVCGMWIVGSKRDFYFSFCYSIAGYCIALWVWSLFSFFVAAYTNNPSSSLDVEAQHLRLNRIRMYQARSTTTIIRERKKYRYVEKRGGETPIRPAEESYKMIMNLIVPLAFLGRTDSGA